MTDSTSDRHAVGELVGRLVAADPVAAATPEAIRVVHAPGRVNLIGEHTDYNGGFVFPAAIDLGITIAFLPTDDRRVVLTLASNGDTRSVDLDAIGPPTGGWVDYVAGTAWAMADADLPTHGFHGLLAADLPAGAGLSSSAAMELAVAWALSAGDLPPTDPMTLARLAQRAENEYVGVDCGLMDQFAVTFGQADHALLFDCRSLEHRAVPLPAGTRLVVCHSGAPRSLATSAFNQRRAECDRAVAILAADEPGIRTLRDVSNRDLEAARDRLDDAAYRRARHVISENARVLAMIAALEAEDLAAVGVAMAASHRSLRDDYEVSSDALDALVGIADGVSGVIGARLTGAGFGGCTINLVRDEAVGSLRAAIFAEYPARTGRNPSVYEVHAADGAGRIA